MYHSGWSWIGRVDYKFSSTGAMVGAWVDVPCYYQSPELPTGCESVALTNALRFYGFNLSKCTIADYYLSRSGSDYITAFMGNPHSGDGGMVCAPGIVLAANKYLKSQNSNLRAHNWTGYSFWDVCQAVTYGAPPIIWTSIGNVSGGYVYCTLKYDGHDYSSIQGTHTVVLCGYDEEKNVVWLADSISGKVKLSYSTMKKLYYYHNSQAVLIY